MNVKSTKAKKILLDGNMYKQQRLQSAEHSYLIQYRHLLITPSHAEKQ